MIPAAFDYVRPSSLSEALDLLTRHGDDAKVLAGGHSLIPAMKLRLARPKIVVDIGRIAGLSYIRDAGGAVAIGSMTPHPAIEGSAPLQLEWPPFPEASSHLA